MPVEYAKSSLDAAIQSKIEKAVGIPAPVIESDAPANL